MSCHERYGAMNFIKETVLKQFHNL